MIEPMDRDEARITWTCANQVDGGPSHG